MDDLGNLPVGILDIAVIVILLISALLAYARGFVQEILSVVGWIGAIFATFYGFPILKPHAREWISIELAADLANGVLIFVFSLFLLSYLTRSISKMVQNSELNALDRALGFLFGLVRGGVIICLAYIGVELLISRDDHPEWLTSAKSMGLIRPGAEKLRSLLPDHAASDPVAEAARKAKEQTEDLLGASKIVRDIIAPKPKGDQPSGEGAYGRKERQDMERLIDSNEDQN